MLQYVEVDSNGNVLQALGEPEQDSPHSYFEYVGVINWKRPTPTSVMRWIDSAPVWVETASLADLKARKNTEINEGRLKANRTSFMFSGKAIACDELSRSDIDGVNGKVTLTGTMPTNWQGAWKAMDNTYVPISDVATWTAFYTAMVDAGEINFQHSQSLKQQLANATTPEEVAAISW